MSIFESNYLRVRVRVDPRVDPCRTLVGVNPSVGSSYLRICSGSAHLRDLTQLTFTLTYDMDWEWFFDIVVATRSTLTSLNIEISAFTANDMYTIPDSRHYQ